ncbi:Ig-like domain-containing protein [Fodinibius sediminis]|uniref:Ig-like domain-containing protein n=1 Tax=Fodinibius sediminis TaxID=1214077 RepID=UPI00163D6B81|nr:Ig-like domain-containing protein [Fodinibius sediminis]
MNKYLLVSTVLSLALLLSGCATPSSPTGGPRDEEGPTIVKTEPETGTTNFSERGIELHFSEFVERSSLVQSIIVEPDIGIEYELDWGRKSVAIEFKRDIPDSTTLIVTIGTELRDTNGNEMASPHKVAVSTGPEIDKGKLFGRIINAQTGEGNEEQRILLYQQPVDLSQKADYIATTDTSGSFQFEYLSAGRYKAFWVDDRNRNKIWDTQQERAQPFEREFVDLAKAGEDTLGAIFVTAVDTLKPVLQGIGLFSSRRLRMRFSENIELTDSTTIQVTDTLGNGVAGTNPLYIPPDEPFVLFAQSNEDLAEEQSYSLDISGVVDSYGNGLEPIAQTFTGSAQEDTTQQRIITRNNLSGYYPTDTVKVTYAKNIDEPAIRDSLKVVRGTELVEQWPNVGVENNILMIAPDSVWQASMEYELRIWDPIIEDYRKLQPTIWGASQLGKIRAVAEDSAAGEIHLRLRNEESEIRRNALFSGEVTIDDLPALQYTVTAFRDRNGNGQWDFGQVAPYVEPEPYFVQPEVPVEQGMTGDLTIVF